MEHRFGDLSPGVALPREFQESDGGGPFTPHRLPEPSARGVPSERYRTPGREIGRSALAAGFVGQEPVATNRADADK